MANNQLPSRTPRLSVVAASDARPGRQRHDRDHRTLERGRRNVTLGGGTLTVNSVSNSSFAGVISGSGGLTKKGPNTLTLNGASAETYTGPTAVLGGTLAVDLSNMAAPANLISAGSPLKLGGGTLQVVGKSGTSSSQTFAGTTVAAGDSAVVAAGGGGATTNIALGTITRPLGATVDFNITAPSGTITTNNTNTNGILGGWATYAGNTWARYAYGANNSIAGLAGYQGDFSASSNNVDVAAGNVNVPGGGPSVNTLRFNANAAASVTIADTLTLNAGGVLVTPAVGGNNATISGGTLAAAAGNDLVLIQNNTRRHACSSMRRSSTTAPSGVTKSGPGNLVLGGANNFGGPLTINGGNVSFAKTSNVGQIVFGAGSTGVLQLLGQSVTVGGLGNADLTSPGASAVENGVNSSAGTLVINNASNYSYAGVIRDGTASLPTNLVKMGEGTQTLMGNDIFTGTVAINAGVLQLGSTGALNGASPRPVSLDTDGTLRLAGNSLTVSALSASSANTAVENQSATAATLAVNLASGANTFAGTIRDGTGTGPLGLSKAGPGTLALTGNNTFSGPITVRGGTLQGSAAAFPAPITLAGADSSAANVTFYQNVDASYKGPINGTGSFTKAGANVLTLTGSQNYSGATYINGGTLALAGPAGGVGGPITGVTADQYGQ